MAWGWMRWGSWRSVWFSRYCLLKDSPVPGLRPKMSKTPAYTPVVGNDSQSMVETYRLSCHLFHVFIQQIFILLLLSAEYGDRPWRDTIIMQKAHLKCPLLSPTVSNIIVSGLKECLKARAGVGGRREKCCFDQSCTIYNYNNEIQENSKT